MRDDGSERRAVTLASVRADLLTLMIRSQQEMEMRKPGTICENGKWYWIPLDWEVLNPKKVKRVGPFRTKEEAYDDGHDHCWALENPTFVLVEKKRKKK